MAELILAAITFPAAVAGTVELLAKYGRYLARKAESWKKAQQTVQDFRDLGVNLFSGNLKTLIDDAVEACAASTTPSTSKTALNRFVDKMAKDLKDSEVLLNKVVRNDGSIRGLWWEVKDREAQLREYLAKFESTQVRIDSQLGVLKRNRDRAVAANHLDPKKFREDTSEAIRDTDLRLGQAKTQDGQGPGTRTISVIYEKRASLGPDLDPEVLKADTSELARSLSSTEQPGILRCLGYRLSPLDLVFEVLAHTGTPQTLWRLLFDEMPQNQSQGPGTLASYSGGHSLETRYKLALQLSQAVLSVHRRNLVHKNIRPNSILMFKTVNGDAADIGTPYLCHWEIVHKAGDMSISNSNTNWQEDVYRHPQRQKFFETLPEPKMGHDIYSLGVCLLEIGLWEPVVVERKPPTIPPVATPTEPPQNPPPMPEAFLALSDTVSQKALELEYITQAELGSRNRTLQPRQVRAVLLALAAQLLPSRMGSVFTELVISCLNCLDDPEQGPPKAEADVQDFDVTGSKFVSLIIGPLSTLHV